MKVSVVIPTYKRPDVLSRAIDSVINQTFKDLEINVVSDGYHLETEQTMEQYKNNSNINFYSYLENRGGNYARNYGITKSQGKYIAFLDDDDLWEPDKIEKQVTLIEKDEIGLVYTGKKQIFTDMNIEFINEAKVVGDLSDKIFEKNYIGSTSCVLVEKELIEEAGMFDEELPSLQDFDLWIRICQLTKVDAVNEPLLIYINEQNKDQVSANIDKRINALELITKKYDVYLNGKEKTKKDLEIYIIETILKIAQRNSDKENLRKFRKIYLNKNNNSIKAYLFILSISLPHNLLLRIRSVLS